MGRLTTEVTRLVGDIHTARDERQRLVRAVRQATFEMKRAVARMQRGFQTARAEMARRQRRDLREFVSGIERRVMAARNGLRTDLAGARAAWLGSVPARTKREQSAAAAGPALESKRAVKATAG